MSLKRNGGNLFNDYFLFSVYDVAASGKLMVRAANGSCRLNPSRIMRLLPRTHLSRIMSPLPRCWGSVCSCPGPASSQPSSSNVKEVGGGAAGSM